LSAFCLPSISLFLPLPTSICLTCLYIFLSSLTIPSSWQLTNAFHIVQLPQVRDFVAQYVWRHSKLSVEAQFELPPLTGATILPCSTIKNHCIALRLIAYHVFEHTTTCRTTPNTTNNSIM
jgi:hypothetical protein